MQRGRSFIVLLVVAVGLGSYIYFFEYGRDPSAGEALEQVFALEPGSIEEIEIRSESGETTRVSKADGEWRITAPLAVNADVSEVSPLVSTIESLEIQRTIDPDPPSVEQYGLDPARFSVSFRTAGETGMQRLDVGETTPTGGDLYARVDGQPALILIAGYLEDSLDKTTFDLRDKTVLDLSRDVDRVRLESDGNTPISLSREDNEWQLSEPLEARGDFGAVDGLISRVFQAEMQSIVSEDGTDQLADFGLDRPRATVTLGTGSAEATLAVGADTDDGDVYARDVSRPMIFSLEATLLDELTKTPADLRSKDVFLFRSFNALALDLTLDGQPLAFSKEEVPAAEEGGTPTTEWMQTAPAAPDVDQAKVTDLLSRISNLRADSFAGQALTSGEELVVVARFGDAAAPSEEQVTFRKSGDVVHAIIPGEPGAAVISTESFDGALDLIKELAGSQ